MSPVAESTSLAADCVWPEAQRAWSQRPLRERLLILKRVRHALAAQQDALLDAFPAELPRTRADSLAAELLPLAAACRFLEKEAPALLRTRRPGRRGRPFWLRGVQSEVERVPFGTVLLIAPSNYPLFLPAVQVLQALCCGNAVIWKPGRGGKPVADVFAGLLGEAGLPEHLLQVTDDSVEAATGAMRAGVDKVVFTGSTSAGRAILALAAETATPVVAELSGCDAVFALPGADHSRLVEALAFGMRLNGSATCMAPRRLMLIGPDHAALVRALRDRFAAMPPIDLSPATHARLRDLVEDAAAAGASVQGDLRSQHTSPVLVLDAHAGMGLVQADVFAPVLSVLSFPDEASAAAADRLCPYGLTAAIFGPEPEARRFGAQLAVGTVLINDLIVPTADPRVPFGGRRSSGFGVTRGAEGLLEMTATRTVLTRRGRDTRHFEPTGVAHRELFGGVLSATHARGWRRRLAGFARVATAVRTMGTRNDSQNSKNGSNR